MSDSKVTPWQWAACVLIVLAQLLDAGTTIAAMELGGYEKNPKMASLLQYGYATYVVFKLVLAVALAIDA